MCVCVHHCRVCVCALTDILYCLCTLPDNSWFHQFVAISDLVVYIKFEITRAVTRDYPSNIPRDFFLVGRLLRNIFSLNKIYL